MSDHTQAEKQGEQQNYTGGAPTTRALTPGGHPLVTGEGVLPVYHRKFASPAPLGLLSFAGTTLLLSFINAHVREVTNNQIVLGMAVGFGGLTQLIAGIWEFASGNTFGATAFCGYGGFWISYAITIYSGAEVLSSYEVKSEETSALGLYLTSWIIFTAIMLFASMRSTVALVALFFFLEITFILLAAGEFTGSTNTAKAGGAFGILTAAIAYYAGAAALLTPEASVFTLPVGDLTRKD